MKFRCTLFSCIILSSILLSFSPPADGPLVDDVLKFTNQFRKSNGLPALVDMEKLNDIARKHSEDMARGRVAFGHGGFDGRDRKARKLITGANAFAENVAYGAHSGKEVLDMWEHSPGHRRNLLGQYKYIGIGVATGRRGVIYYTQVFVN